MNFSNVLLKTKSYKECKYEQALIDAFLKFDEMLGTESVDNMLKRVKMKSSDDKEYKLAIEYIEEDEEESTFYRSKKSSEDSSFDVSGFPNIEDSALPKSPKQRSDLISYNMGTTANICLIKDNYLYLANVGDSLAVLYKNGIAVKLNQEHKTSLDSERERILKSGASIINNRIEGRLNLTRAIGRY
jgi:serine/threonine protein phosphatase PrpC